MTSTSPSHGGTLVLLVVLAAASGSGLAQAPHVSERHTVVASDRIQWKPLRPGAEIAVVSGDPNKEGSPFVMRFGIPESRASRPTGTRPTNT